MENRSEIKIRIKGYKKSIGKIRTIRMELEQLNETARDSIELLKRISQIK